MKKVFLVALIFIAPVAQSFECGHVVTTMENIYNSKIEGHSEMVVFQTVTKMQPKETHTFWIRQMAAVFALKPPHTTAQRDKVVQSALSECTVHGLTK
jgi:hypothetical protein